MAEEKKSPVPAFKIRLDGSELPPEALAEVRSVTVDQDLGGADMVSIVMSDRERRWMDDDRFDPGSSVEIELGYVDATEKVFHGEILAQEPAFREDRPTLLRIIGYDLSHRLQRGKVSRSFVEMKDSQIAEEIASEVGLSARVDDTGVERPSVIQDNMTNLEFLHWRASLYGFEVEMEEETLCFRKPPTDGASVATLEWGRNLKSFRPDLTAAGQISEVVVRGWDPKAKRFFSGTASIDGDVPAEGGAKLGAEEAKRGLDPSRVVVTDRKVASPKEAEDLARAILRDQAQGFVVARGRARGDPKIGIGARLEILGVGEAFTGSYYVQGCRHSIDSSGYSLEFTGARNALGAGPAGEETAAEAEKEEAAQAIEIRFVDEKGEAIADHDYVITFSDGTEKTGTLGGDGTFRADNVPRGSVRVRLAPPEDEEEE